MSNKPTKTRDELAALINEWLKSHPERGNVTVSRSRMSCGLPMLAHVLRVGPCLPALASACGKSSAVLGSASAPLGKPVSLKT